MRSAGAVEVLERALVIGEREYGPMHKEISCTIASTRGGLSQGGSAQLPLMLRSYNCNLPGILQTCRSLHVFACLCM